MTKTPTVSVIMTVYNGERYLAQAIESIRQQSLRDFELVIVDDGSNDRSPEILDEAQADPRIKIITKPRLGRARALNTAWTLAGGLYIANLDADDLAEPARLERQVAFLERHPQIGLLGTACRVLDEDAGTESILHRPQTNRALRAALVRRNPFVHSSVMMPRSVLDKVGGYNEDFRVLIDCELWVRIACRFGLGNLPDVLTVKRYSRSNYFRNRAYRWEKCKARTKLNWQAWQSFSRNATELPFVFFEPLATFCYKRVRDSCFKRGRIASLGNVI